MDRPTGNPGTGTDTFPEPSPQIDLSGIRIV